MNDTNYLISSQHLPFRLHLVPVLPDALLIKGRMLVLNGSDYLPMCLMHLSMLTPRGGGRAKGGDLIRQVVPWVGIWTDTFFLSGPRVGIFDRLTLISDDILKKPEQIFEQTEDWALVHRSLSRMLFLQEIWRFLDKK
jgi:hypothetical protein